MISLWSELPQGRSPSTELLVIPTFAEKEKDLDKDLQATELGRKPAGYGVLEVK